MLQKVCRRQGLLPRCPVRGLFACVYVRMFVRMCEQAWGFVFFFFFFFWKTVGFFYDFFKDTLKPLTREQQDAKTESTPSGEHTGQLALYSRRPFFSPKNCTMNGSATKGYNGKKHKPVFCLSIARFARLAAGFFLGQCPAVKKKPRGVSKNTFCYKKRRIAPLTCSAALIRSARLSRRF